MFGIGFSEILIIALLALILFGQDDLPANIRKAANGLKEFRKVTSNAQRAWHDVRNDMTRTLLEESDKEIGQKPDESAAFPKKTTVVAAAPLSSQEIVEGERAQPHDHHHADDHRDASQDQSESPEHNKPRQQASASPTVVIRTPDGIIPQGTPIDA